MQTTCTCTTSILADPPSKRRVCLPMSHVACRHHMMRDTPVQTGVYDVDDVGYRDGAFGDVCGEDHLHIPCIRIRTHLGQVPTHHGAWFLFLFLNNRMSIPCFRLCITWSVFQCVKMRAVKRKQSRGKETEIFVMKIHSHGAQPSLPKLNACRGNSIVLNMCMAHRVHVPSQLFDDCQTTHEPESIRMIYLAAPRLSRLDSEVLFFTRD
jgi:hypothetical protein